MRKLIFLILILAAAALTYIACMVWEAETLREEYPQYFDLDASGGLDIVVWQMARDSYSFGLLPHSDEPRENTDPDLMDLEPVTAQQMRIILSTYIMDVDKMDIEIWHNPASSYLPDDLIGHGGDGPFLVAAYKNKIQRMLLFGKVYSVFSGLK